MYRKKNQNLQLKHLDSSDQTRAKNKNIKPRRLKTRPSPLYSRMIASIS